MEWIPANSTDFWLEGANASLSGGVWTLTEPLSGRLDNPITINGGTVSGIRFTLLTWVGVGQFNYIQAFFSTGDNNQSASLNLGSTPSTPQDIELVLGAGGFADYVKAVWFSSLSFELFEHAAVTISDIEIYGGFSGETEGECCLTKVTGLTQQTTITERTTIVWVEPPPATQPPPVLVPPVQQPVQEVDTSWYYTKPSDVVQPDNIDYLSEWWLYV